MKQRTTIMMALILALGAALPEATTVRRMHLEDLVRESDWIVVARPLSSHSAWDADHRLIWTYTTVEVSDSLKGEAPRRLVVAELGGEVGDIGLRVSGTPRFQIGEESLLFLVRTASQKIRVLGLFQGKMEISVDSASGERFVAPTVTELGGIEQSVTSSLRLALANYRSHIRSLLEK